MPDFDPSQHDQDHESNALVKGPRRVTHAHIGTAEARAQFEAAEEAEHPAGEFQAVDPGHQDVANHQCRRRGGGGDCGQGGGGTVGHLDRPMLGIEDRLDQLAHRRHIIHEQNPAGGGR